MNQRRVIAEVNWPWAKDKKASEVKVTSKIADSMKMKRQHGTGTAILPLKRLKPITEIVRRSNGEINKKAVKNLIHSLEGMLQESR